MNPEYARLTLYFMVALKAIAFWWGASGMLGNAIAYRQLVGLQKFYFWIGAPLAVVGGIWLMLMAVFLLFATVYPYTVPDTPPAVIYFLIFAGIVPVLCASMHLGVIMTEPNQISKPASL